MIKTEELKHLFGIEASALVLVCRVFVGTATDQELHSFISTNDIDWDLFYKISSSHQVRPVVYKVLHKYAIPADVKNRLQADCRLIALHNFEQTGEMIKLFGQMHNAGITAIPYKGSIYAIDYYKDIGLREFSDIDFLINLNELEATKIIFKQLGYQDKSEVPIEFRATHLNHTREYNFDLYKNDIRKYHVEFHWFTASAVIDFPTPLPVSVLFKGLEEREINGNKVNVLNSSYHLLAMVTHHGLNQRWSVMKYIVDLAMILKNGSGLQPSEIINISKTYGFNNALNIGLYISSHLLGINNESIYTTPVHGQEYLEDLLSSSVKTRKKTSEVLWLNLKIKDDLPARLKMIFKYIRSAATPSLLDYQFLKLPRSMFFLYAAIKPVRIIVNSIKKREE